MEGHRNPPGFVKEAVLAQYADMDSRVLGRMARCCLRPGVFLSFVEIL